jgi:hypothetical protein
MKAAISPYSMAVAADTLSTVAAPAKAIRVAARTTRILFSIIVISSWIADEGRYGWSDLVMISVRDQRSVKRRQVAQPTPDDTNGDGS